MQKLLQNVDASVEVEENGDILVFADEKDVKIFVKNIAKQFEASRKG